MALNGFAASQVEVVALRPLRPPPAGGPGKTSDTEKNIVHSRRYSSQRDEFHHLQPAAAFKFPQPASDEPFVRSRQPPASANPTLI